MLVAVVTNSLVFYFLCNTKKTVLHHDYIFTVNDVTILCLHVWRTLSNVFCFFCLFLELRSAENFFLWLYVSERKLFTTQLGSERRDNASERTYYPNIAQKGVIEETSAK